MQEKIHNDNKAIAKANADKQAAIHEDNMKVAAANAAHQERALGEQKNMNWWSKLYGGVGAFCAMIGGVIFILVKIDERSKKQAGI